MSAVGRDSPEKSRRSPVSIIARVQVGSSRRPAPGRRSPSRAPTSARRRHRRACRRRSASGSPRRRGRAVALVADQVDHIVRSHGGSMANRTPAESGCLHRAVERRGVDDEPVPDLVSTHTLSMLVMSLPAMISTCGARGRSAQKSSIPRPGDAADHRPGQHLVAVGERPRCSLLVAGSDRRPDAAGSVLYVDERPITETGFDRTARGLNSSQKSTDRLKPRQRCSNCVLCLVVLCLHRPGRGHCLADCCGMIWTCV